MKLLPVRSSHRRCSVRKGVLGNFAKFIGKHLCQCLFFNIVAGLRHATLLKKRLWQRCFPVNFPKFLRTTFLQNPSGRLLLICLGRWNSYLSFIVFAFWTNESLHLELSLRIKSHFWPIFPFYTFWKHQKIFSFLIFSGSLKWEHWPDMS